MTTQIDSYVRVQTHNTRQLTLSRNLNFSGIHTAKNMSQSGNSPSDKSPSSTGHSSTGITYRDHVNDKATHVGQMEVTEVVETSRPTRADIPKEVRPAEDSGLPRGVEAQALVLARAFMAAQGQLARKCYRRGELSHLYVTTFESWAPEDAKSDQSLQRPFKQILFALAHGMKLVRVINSGRQLLWNRYRDNTGAQIEASAQSRRDNRPRDYRDDRRPNHRDNRPPRHRDDRHYRHRDDRRRRRYDHSPTRPNGRDSDTAFLERDRHGNLVMARDQERAAFEAARHRWENERRRRRSRTPPTNRYESNDMDYDRSE